MNIKDFFNDDIKEILSEESMSAIQDAIDKKIEFALESQDEEYATKLTALIESIDKDHTNKLQRVVQSHDKNNTAKLLNIVKKYERTIHVESKKYKKDVIKGVSAFLDEFLEESINKDDLQQAVRNTNAYNILADFRKVLGVNGALMKESVQTAIIEGKTQIDTLRNDKKEIAGAFKTIYEENQSLKIDLFLEKKLSGFSQDKQKFVRSTFKGKPLEYIEENFDYTVRMFERSSKDKQKDLKDEAIKNRKVKTDFVPQQKVVEEKVNNKETVMDDIYVSELSKMWSSKSAR